MMGYFSDYLEHCDGNQYLTDSRHLLRENIQFYTVHGDI